MQFEEVVPVTEARARLSDLVRRAAEGQVVLIGPHRKATAAIVSPSRVIADSPPLMAAAHGVAYDAVFHNVYSPGGRDQWMHPGDPFGKFLVWLWNGGAEYAATTMIESLYENTRAAGFPESFSEVFETISFAITDDVFVRSTLPLIRQRMQPWVTHNGFK